MIYSKIKNPVWANYENTLIDCLVTFETLGEVPFTSSLDDTEYSYEIFTRCSLSEFGPVADYVITVVAATNQPSTTGTQTL